MLLISTGKLKEFIENTKRMKKKKISSKIKKILVRLITLVIPKKKSRRKSQVQVEGKIAKKRKKEWNE